MASASQEPSKKCWNCFVRLPLEVTQCYSCRKKVGDINEHGIARKPLDWLGYTLAIGSMSAFVYYIWWLFLHYNK
ncbi:MAG: hypothetical protein BWK80_44650 [Desulfobacteraceae bacterium IS3]|jgi:hypothetical protein|nr:MAG: hypothetical protein BWK80_44650 [Desulfobacteraceae bacterium IS3]HAO19319.1 hypothetical protein [Desulfobacteraceae bacterium]